MFAGVCAISLNFDVNFLDFPWEIVPVVVISGSYLNLQLLENAITTLTYLKLFWNYVFVHLNLKTLQPLIPGMFPGSPPSQHTLTKASMTCRHVSELFHSEEKKTQQMNTAKNNFTCDASRTHLIIVVCFS